MRHARLLSSLVLPGAVHTRPVGYEAEPVCFACPPAA